MARSALLLGESSGPVIDAINLRRLIIRLEQQILVPGPDSRILHSSLERSKVAQNVEYARTLLLRLEHNTPSIKIQARKHAQQAELARHRALIKRLTERLYELNRRDDDLGSGQAEQQEEDILGEYFAPEPATVKPTHSRDSSTTAPTATSEGLRGRGIEQTTMASASATKGPTSALADELFGRNKTNVIGTATIGGEMTAEKQLEHQDSIQADLTSLLVQQARQLKLGSLEFQQTLQEDEEVRARAEGTIGKSAESMDIASRSMGTLRRMSEGRWFWQRYIMFILIAVLWFVERVSRQLLIFPFQSLLTTFTPISKSGPIMLWIQTYANLSFPRWDAGFCGHTAQDSVSRWQNGTPSGGTFQRQKPSYMY